MTQRRTSFGLTLMWWVPLVGFVTQVSAQTATPSESWKSCVALVSDNRHSILEIDPQLSTPQNLQQLLKNLRVIWEQNLILQPALFSEATLQMILGGTKVSWDLPPNFYKIQGTEYAFASVSGGTLPLLGSTVKCSCIKQTLPSGYSVSLIGFLTTEIGSRSSINLKDIKEVFGNDGRTIVDSGIDPHGYTYLHAYKGSVVYDNKRPGEKVQSQVIFYLRLSPSDSTSYKIVDTDIVERIEIREEQAQSGRSPS